MACAQRLALALLGLAAVGCGMSIHRINGSVGKPKFDPTSDSVLVYSRPKTGTNTLQNAVGDIMQPPCDVPFNHSKTFRAMKCHVPDVAANFMKHRKEGSRTWVIISIRNPFSRYLSGFFQHLSRDRKSWKRNMIGNLSMTDLHRMFHKRLAKSHDSMKHHFDYFFLDLEAHPFDFNKKFLHVSHEWKKRHLEIIFVRLEDSSLWESILKEFFPTIRIGAASNVASQGGNIGGNQVLAKKFQQFLKTVQWTTEEIEWISQSEQISHFYSMEEMDAFIDRANNASSRLAAHTDIDEFSVEDADDFSVEDDGVEDEDSEDRAGKRWNC